MYIKLFLLFGILFFTACSDSKPIQNYDAKQLLEQKCSSCHDLHMPPVLSDDELAPPMMAVTFHVRDFVSPTNEAQRTSTAISYVQDYVINPSLEKSFCDKQSLKRYGLMPSQAGNVDEAQLKAIAEYMFQTYTRDNLLEAQKIQNKLNAMPKGKRVAIKYKCLSCHKVDRDLVGPSFQHIAQRYKNSQTIQESIQNGSQHKWKGFKGVMMPKFKDIQPEELQNVSEWILQSYP